MKSTDPTKNKPEKNTGDRNGYAVPVSYKTPVILLIATSSKSRVGNGEK